MAMNNRTLENARLIRDALGRIHDAADRGNLLEVQSTVNDALIYLARVEHDLLREKHGWSASIGGSKVDVPDIPMPSQPPQARLWGDFEVLSRRCDKLELKLAECIDHYTGLVEEMATQQDYANNHHASVHKRLDVLLAAIAKIEKRLGDEQ